MEGVNDYRNNAVAEKRRATWRTRELTMLLRAPFSMVVEVPDAAAAVADEVDEERTLALEEIALEEEVVAPATAAEDDPVAPVAVLVAEVLEVLAAAEEPVEPEPPAEAGGATACEGSTRVPTPHGMASPELGWTLFAGSVVSPVGEVIVKRVVQALVSASVAVNW